MQQLSKRNNSREENALTEVSSAPWGNTPDGQDVVLYTLTNESVVVKIASYGARLTSVRVADRTGVLGEAILGSDDLAPYVSDRKTFMGAIVGRFGNRIAKGQFSIDGKSFQVPLNDGPNCLHGGPVGFDQKVWSAAEVPGGVAFTYVSPAGEMGFPGMLRSTVTYTLEGSSLRLDYEAVTDAPTVVNMTNHAYFNLAGDGGDLAAHTMQLHAERFTPVDDTLIPTGELRPVAGTPLDFRAPKAIGQEIGSDDEQMRLAGGYDHNWVLTNPADAAGLRSAAFVADPASGRTLTVLTTEPGIQFYSGNFLDGSFPARSGGSYTRRAGFCLETQHFPDAPNHPDFATTIVRPGETLRSTTIFRFDVTS